MTGAACRRCRRTHSHGPDGHYRVRGLCWSCYEHVRRAGQVADWPRTTRPAAEVVEDYRWLRSNGLRDRKVIAERIGMTLPALDKALHRAVNRGLITGEELT